MCSTNIELNIPLDSPQALHRAFEAFVNSGNAAGLAALYVEDAALVLREGEAIRGVPAIRDYFCGLLKLHPTMKIDAPLQILRSGDLALLIADWRLNGIGADSLPVYENGRTYDIVKQQADGTWRIVFDSPWGQSHNIDK